VGEAVGTPGAVVAVTVSPVRVLPGVLVVAGIAVVMMVVGTVVGTGVTSLPGCVVQPTHRIAAPMIQMRNKGYGLFMKET
jgi:hypothetical protein